jgi:hypothetical protein
VRDVTAVAAEVALRMEEQASAVEARDRLEDVVARLRLADQRLRASDERTKRALSHLRAVPEQ